ncbi:YitT family protein [Geobacillus stearothermophilus]|uniref:YitT family protein n=1 Tax=Geobacillus stearothermophilus TaxID=1422 RepID=UPI002402A76B|nr:YitT family protein [Geobacillus stearothermophilus]MED4878928.1 YitT family protein [Anoxybacillus geothermalis]MDF9296734.1 YitT family protein [Geobacillus stearothermophilus]WJQ01962.1 YitT family protein [Geobacillus stearothermophilus]WJQ05355.1 YitT family protein [Geobacillus stearothermophilus]WJQ12347.1 YitT family protein [Geobacillus stearothermophilus]
MIKKMAAVIVGSLLLGVGINVFFVPHHLLDGGMIGLGLIAKYVWNVQAGLTMIVLSVPLYVAAWFYYRPFFYNSLHGLLFSSWMIDVLSVLRGVVALDPLWSAMIGGILVGAGIGLMLREETSTGGTDLLAQFIARLTNWNVGVVIFVIDACIISAGSLIIDSVPFVHSLVVVTVVGVVTTMLTREKTMGV